MTDTSAMPPRPSATSQQSAEAADRLLRFWRAGRRTLSQVRRLRPKKSDDVEPKSRWAALNQLAKGQGILAVTLAQSCRIAEAFDEGDIRALGRLVIRHRARFGPSHLSRLLAVQDEGRRESLVRDAVESRWGVADISRAVQALNGARSHVGKRPNI